VTFRAGARISTAIGSMSGAVVLLLAFAGTVVAASPSPSGTIGGDPRSSGQGPGLVGDPATAILLVLGIGLVTVVVTLLYVKATGGKRG
jgi:hypothetical protein